MKEIKGRCLCGVVEYSIPDQLIYSGFCHCSECRRTTGSSFTVSGGVPKADFKLLADEEKLSCYQKGEHTQSYFCKTCGSTLYGLYKDTMVYVHLGTLDEAPSLKPQWHIHTASKAEWDEIHDTIPQHEAQLIRN